MKKHVICILATIAMSVLSPVQVFATENIDNIAQFLANIL